MSDTTTTLDPQADIEGSADLPPIPAVPDPQPPLEAGQQWQQCLSGYLWDQYEVPTVKAGISGSLALGTDVLDLLSLDVLEPGARVIMSVGCTVCRIALEDKAGVRTGVIAFRLETIRGAEVVAGEGGA